jgi:para-nitrobenzyl esterase
MRLFTDAGFTCTARRAARAMASHDEPVWRYEFTRVPPALTPWGAFHGAEIPYVFGTFDSLAYGPADDTLGGHMQGYWSSFARTGDPNGPSRPTWPRYLTTHEDHMILNESLGQGSDLRVSHCDLLDSLQ